MKRNRLLEWFDRPTGLRSRVKHLLALRRMDRQGYTPEEMADFIEVHDRGSDVTVMALAGMGVLYGGMVKYEFRRLLGECGADCNIVFLRDIRRLMYHLRPDGQPDGLAFFETQIRQCLTSLGSRANVILGTSVGASAAMYFGARCGVDSVLAFSPVLDARVYARPGEILATVCNARRAFREPQAYLERVAIALATPAFLRRIDKFVGRENLWDVVGTLASSKPRPKTALFFGAENRIDARISRQFAHFDEVELVPVPTGVHNTAGFLKKKGELGRIIIDHIRAAMNRHLPQPQSSG